MLEDGQQAGVAEDDPGFAEQVSDEQLDSGTNAHGAKSRGGGIDLLIANGELVPLGDAGQHVWAADIAVVDSEIVGVGRREALEGQFGPSSEVLDARGRYVMPGIVNAHTHLFQAAFRGLGDGLDLSEWRDRVMRPIYDHLTAEDAYFFSMLGALENLRSGVTTAVTFQASPNDVEACELVAQAVGEAGLRSWVVKALASPTANRPGDWESVFGALYELLRRPPSYDGRIRFAAGPSRPSAIPSEWLQEAHAMAQQFDSRLHTHVAEAKENTREIKALHGKSDVAYLQGLGILDDRLQAVHCVDLDSDDLALLANSRTTAVHCPIANMYLADGIADVVSLRQAGVNVALGSDGPASNNNQDMFAVMKVAALLQRTLHTNPQACAPLEALHMATLNGAVACDFAGGSIAVGQVADLVVLDLSGLNNQPMHDPVTAIVFSAQASDVETVIVGGRVAMRKRVFASVDDAEVIAEAEQRVRALLGRAGLA